MEGLNSGRRVEARCDRDSPPNQACLWPGYSVRIRHGDVQSKEALVEALLANLAHGSEGVVFELERARHGLTAAARETGETLLVLAGSQAKLAWNGQAHSYQQLRDELVAQGALKLSSDEQHWEFTCDTPFKSPSAASAVVLGRPDNGRNSWRIKGTTVTYAAWQDNLPATKAASGRSET